MSAPDLAVQRGPAPEKDSDKEEEKEEDDGYPNVNATLVIFADLESKS